MNSDEALFSGMMQTSVTSDSSTLSGLATGPIPGVAMNSGGPPGGLAFDTDGSYAVMNDKVQALAGSIYEELERMITKYDQEVVKNLMPLIVNVLESLDLAYTETQELEVELELLKEDNEQLVTQYEREKQLRKGSDQKVLEIEDAFEGERKESTIKVESLTSIVKMFELKSKNSQDHIVRLEDKENDMKKEYSKLHERYTELFKTHIDYMERTKSILGTERLDQMQTGAGTARNRIAGMALNQLNRSSGPVSFGYSELENNNQQASILSSADFAAQTTPGIDRTNTSLKTELMGPSPMDNRPGHSTGGWMDGSHSDTRMVDLEVEEAEDVTGDPEFGPDSPASVHREGKGLSSKSQTKTEKRTGNTLYQELSFQDSEALGDVDEGADITDSDSEMEPFPNSVNDNYFGMGKEVENLISENNELLATKNALNIVKDDLITKVDELSGEHEILREEIKSLQDVRSRLQQRIQELEEELKKFKEDAEAAKATKTEEEEDVPMAQRKRFTRVEMARVLMERNQYKEKFMELQEAVRWTEMLRASRTTEPAASDKKNNKGIWKFFGSLFSGNERMGDPMGPYLNIKYSGSSPEASEAVTPALSTMRARSSAERKSRNAGDVFDGDTLSSTNDRSSRRANERKEQYKQVRAHVKKEDGRMQAYGWSVPAASSKSDEEEQQQPSKQQLPVPVPVYCRPLMEKEPGMKIWCAAAVNMTGGRTKDGGDIVGASVFYNEPPHNENGDQSCGSKTSGGGENTKSDDPVVTLDNELSEGKRMVDEAVSREKELSSHVWICTSTHSISKVTVIDANSPADVLESFHVCSSHLLCIASVPGAKESDYRVDEELNRLVLEESELRDADAAKKNPDEASEDDSGLGAVSFVTCAVGSEQVGEGSEDAEEQETEPKLTKETSVPLAPKMNRPSELEDTDAVHRRFQLRNDGQTSAKVRDGVSEVSRQNEIAFSEVEKMSSVLPTMWLGSQSGAIYVHSAVAQWKRCIHSIRLKDSVLCIVHVKGRVMAALANGTIAIFHRSGDGQWDLTNYHVLDLGKPHSSIRCMVQVHNKVWCGYKNKIYVVNPKMMTVETMFDAHPRKESQVRLMAWTGDGVWVSIRLDSTLRMYHAHTHEHLQDVDIEPYVSKMLGTGKLGFSFVRITSLIVSVNRLWMGTGNGVIISVPLAGPSNAAGQIYSDNRGESLTAETFVPFCNMAQAQLSFHGHRDAVKFFVAVPGHGGLSMASAPSSSPDSNDSMLIVSGGEGYIDFRIVDDGTDQDYDSHIMVWQVRRSMSSNINDTSKSPSSTISSPKSSPDATSKTLKSMSPSFGQRVLNSISPSIAQKTFKSMSPSALRQKSPSPKSQSENALRSRSSSVETVSSSATLEHISLAREATEQIVGSVHESSSADSRTSPIAEQTSSYLRWNQNVESMIEYPEPGEDFTQLPNYGSENFDRGLN